MEFQITTSNGCKLIFTDSLDLRHKVTGEYHLAILDAHGAELSTHTVSKDDIKRLAKAS